MDQFDINAYIEGRLDGVALATFEQAMQENAELKARVLQLQQLTDDIEMSALSEEVTSILNNARGEANKGRTKWPLVLLGGCLLVVAGLFVLQNLSTPTLVAPKEIKQPNPVPETDSETLPPLKENSREIEKVEPSKKSTPIQKQPKKKNIPIAETKPLKPLLPPLHPSPQVRGLSDDNEAWQKLLNNIWYTDFPPPNTVFVTPYEETASLLENREFKKAFIKLELQEMKRAASDTLRFLKAYCLLEMGEGGDAYRYFTDMENPPTQWKEQVDWYTSLSVLSSKGISEAIPFFQNIAKNSTHSYVRQSKKALKELE